MIIQLEDGRKLEVPDGASSEDIDATITEVMGSGPKYYASVAGNPAATDQVRQELEGMKRNLPTMPDKLPFGMTPEMVNAASDRAKQFNSMVEGAQNDPAKRAQYELGKRATGGEAFGVSAANEVAALGKGIADLGDRYLPAWASNIMHGGGSPEERMAQRKKDMAEQNAMQEGLDLSHPFASMSGKAVPYLASDIALSPAINAVGSTALRAATPLAKNILRGAELGEQAAARSASPLAQQLGKLVAEPIVTSGKFIKNAPTLDKEYLKGIQAVARAPIIGAAEGGANYNSTAGQGAINSLGGQALGAFGNLSKLGRVANRLEDSEALALKNAIREGYRATPGMRTGNLDMQKFEKGLRSENGFDLYMQSVDDANNAVKAKMAAKAMGLEHIDSKDLSPSVLSQHLDNLKREYTDLENTTTGKMGLGKVREAGDILKELQPTANRNTSPQDLSRYQTVKSIFDQFKAEIASPRRGAGGRFEGYEFNGSQYQSIRQRVQDEASQAYRNGDNRLGDQLTKMRDVLDSSLTQGMGKAKASAWKDANERYAMTNLVMKHGMDSLGGIDASKLGAHLMSDAEAIRTLTGSGNRIKHLQDIEKITQLEKRQGGGVDWNGTGIEQSTAKSGMLKRLLTMPMTSTLAPTKRAGMSLYMSGYPSVMGYTGLSKPTIARIARAESQAGGIPNAALNEVKGLGQSLVDMYNATLK